jgi:hypothetical protein
MNQSVPSRVNVIGSWIGVRCGQRKDRNLPTRRKAPNSAAGVFRGEIGVGHGRKPERAVWARNDLAQQDIGRGHFEHAELVLGERCVRTSDGTAGGQHAWQEQKDGVRECVTFGKERGPQVPLALEYERTGMVDPGTGSSFEAREKRGYILTYSVGATDKACRLVKSY